MLDGNHQVIKPIVKTLFEPEERRLASWIDQICDRNQKLYVEHVTGYLYGGVFYKPSNVQLMGPLSAHPKKPLHPSLEAEMTDYLRDQSGVNLDRALISQTLFSLISPCRSDQDIRDTLPECLVKIVSDLSIYPREREPAWSVENNNRALRQYRAILPKIEVYSVARIIY